ncbi:hypothetical protein Taro_042981 [Colocasia esculenta]|uniref:Uncharacterized protein n=1 Tax=Colocasia esculenta TaxID=4460 RepID=A0A843WF91_COLES|nr:hypothetical protein [Colocasia esculenta]
MLAGGVPRLRLFLYVFGWPTTHLRVCACFSPTGHVVGYKLAVRRGFVVLPHLFAWCLALEGLGHRGRPEFYPVQASQSFVSPPRSTLVPEPRREVRREATAWPGCGVACIGVLMGLHDGYSLVVPSSRGHRWSGLVRTCASGGFRWVFSQFRSPVLGCQSVVAPASVVSRPGGVSRVPGGSACGPSTLWRSEVAVLEALFARLTPLLPSARGSSSRELGVGRVAEAAVAPCVDSSSESECCELLYLSELRVVFCKSSGYAP